MTQWRASKTLSCRFKTQQLPTGITLCQHWKIQIWLDWRLKVFQIPTMQGASRSKLAMSTWRRWKHRLARIQTIKMRSRASLRRNVWCSTLWDRPGMEASSGTTTWSSATTNSALNMAPTSHNRMTTRQLMSRWLCRTRSKVQNHSLIPPQVTNSSLLLWITNPWLKVNQLSRQVMAT